MSRLTQAQIEQIEAGKELVVPTEDTPTTHGEKTNVVLNSFLTEHSGQPPAPDSDYFKIGTNWLDDSNPNLWKVMKRCGQNTGDDIVVYEIENPTTADRAILNAAITALNDDKVEGVLSTLHGGIGIGHRVTDNSLQPDKYANETIEMFKQRFRDVFGITQALQTSMQSVPTNISAVDEELFNDIVNFQRTDNNVGRTNFSFSASLTSNIDNYSDIYINAEGGTAFTDSTDSPTESELMASFSVTQIKQITATPIAIAGIIRSGADNNFNQYNISLNLQINGNNLTINASTSTNTGNINSDARRLPKISPLKVWGRRYTLS